MPFYRIHPRHSQPQVAQLLCSLPFEMTITIQYMNSSLPAITLSHNHSLLLLI